MHEGKQNVTKVVPCKSGRIYIEYSQTCCKQVPKRKQNSGYLRKMLA